MLCACSKIPIQPWEGKQHWKGRDWNKRKNDNSDFTALLAYASWCTVVGSSSTFYSFIFIFILCFIFHLFIFRERGREGDWVGEKHRYVVTSCMPPTGNWPETQACALIGNRTGDPLVCRLALNPLSHTSQGRAPHLRANFINECFRRKAWKSYHKNCQCKQIFAWIKTTFDERTPSSNNPKMFFVGKKLEMYTDTMVKICIEYYFIVRLT